MAQPEKDEPRTYSEGGHRWGRINNVCIKCNMKWTDFEVDNRPRCAGYPKDKQKSGTRYQWR